MDRLPRPMDRRRDRLYQSVMEHGWSEERNAFGPHYDSDALDASNLIMPLVFFMAPSDPC